MSFIAELKRRNVIRMAGLYLVGAWLVVQVSSTVLPTFDVPSWALRGLIITLAVGFIPMLIFSWVFELTPDGIKRDAEVRPEESIAPQTAHRMDRTIIVVLVIALAYFGFDKFVLAPRREATQITQAVQTSAQKAAMAVNTKSIAVLPFENLSADKDNAYFAIGMQDEILTRLAKIGALKVISRTSTQHYASNPGNLPEIARQLGVANILEGSVQKAGDSVHINVQLIRAATDDHLWAEVYDRKLDNIFGVEGEVAGTIADKLNAKLTGAEQAAVAKKPTDNLPAYEAYLRGRAISLAGYDFATMRKAAAVYADAVRLDPKFAAAWAQLAMTTGYLYFNHVDTDKYTAQSIKLAADTALQLQPQLDEAQLAQASYLYRVLRDFAGAQQTLETLVQRSPNNNIGLQLLGLVERRQGNWEQSLAHLRQASTLDPRNAGLMTAIGSESLVNLRRYDEGRDWMNRALKITPANPYTLATLVNSYQVQGRLEDAARLLDSIPGAAADPGLAFATAYQHALEHRYTEAIAVLQPLLSKSDDDLNGFGPLISLQLGIAQRASGDKAKAQATFQQLIARIEPMARQVDDTDLPVTLARAYAYAGNLKAALEQARRAVDLFGNDAIQGQVAEQGLAEVQMLGGDRDAGIAGLARSLKAPSGITQSLLRLDPIWDPLRRDPRFQKLIANAEVAQARIKP